MSYDACADETRADETRDELQDQQLEPLTDDVNWECMKCDDSIEGFGQSMDAQSWGMNAKDDDDDDDDDDDNNDNHFNRTHTIEGTQFRHVLGRLKSMPHVLYTLEGITEVILDYNSINQLTEEFCNSMISIKVLSMMGNRLTQLPENINKLVNLESLRLDENHINALCDNICGLTNLKQLTLQGNHIQELPNRIGQLKCIEILHLNENKLKSLPESFGNLINLINFDLSYNTIKSLPENFGSLQSLRTLNLSHNNLAQLPESIENLSRVESLELSSNSLKFLPKKFASASVLRKLLADENELNFLPFWIGEMPNIEDISMQSNYLRGDQFPECFGYNNQKLVRFDVSGNLLESLPKSFDMIETLQFIDIGSALFESERRRHLRHGNNISHLPQEFGSRFFNITEMRLDENSITELPQCFGNGMPNLVTLDMYCNAIRSLPESICKLTKLKVLLLGMNALMRLPQNFGNLTELRELRLEQNELTDLPITFGKLTNLITLDLFGNKFVIFPSVLKELPNIKQLEFNLKIKDMGIVCNGVDAVALERLNNALRCEKFPRNKYWHSFRSNSIEFNKSGSSNDAPSPSSACNSDHTVKNQSNSCANSVSADESWDSFDPMNPYEDEPLYCPESLKIMIPIKYKGYFMPKNLRPPKLNKKVKKFKANDGQFDDS